MSLSSGLIQDIISGTTSIRFDRGVVILTPYAARTTMKVHRLQFYQRHCIQTSCEQTLNRSTELCLLGACKMGEKKIVCGLDSFSVDGNATFDTFQRLVKELQMNNVKEKELLKRIKLSRNCLKFEYRQIIH